MPGNMYDVPSMRDRVLSTIFLALASTLGGCRPPEIVPDAPPATAEQSARAIRFVDSVATAQRLPAFAATVSVGHAVVFRHGTGFADVASRTPVTTSTRFRVGSVSKLLTATLLMRLAQTGRIDLDAPLSRYLSVPPMLGAATLRQLAGHLGGVRHYRGSEFLTNTHYETLADAIGVFAADSLVAPPGTRYSYSSYGYNLIGAAIERVMREPFPDVMRRNVLEPLNLDATVPDRKGVTIPGRASLYMINNGAVTGVPDDDLSGRWPSGGYLSSTDDLARLGRLILAPGLLDKRSLETMLTPQQLASGAATTVGIGWRVGKDSVAGPYYHHGGTSNGGSAFVLVFPRQQLVVAMASNALGQWSEREALLFARLFLP